ncbi:hypothetical protein [Sphingomonas sp.]|uniref:hypothetical protein n=1 Tax=Sphingomonas sp. TaxID=28214 RepID=UPI002D8110B7|nr:hypothetical protein [Sphingomonas sp.]HEU0043396.1 hypothetical protein [Sphingomonas sp.]
MMRKLPTIGGAAAGALIALTFVLLPATWLEGAVVDSGIAALLPVAEPPLGTTARAVLALGGGMAVAAVVWAGLYLLFGPGGLIVAKPVRKDAPTVRRADAHPDAPPRWPLSVAELTEPAAPLPPVEQDLPADLDVPLAAFDPAAVLPVPHEPVRPVKPLATLAPAASPVLEPGERLETFALKAPVKASAAPSSDEPPSIDALLRRLEQGARRRVVAR